MKLVKMLTPPIKASVISVFVFAVAPVWAFDWPTGGGSVTIPSGEVAEISSAADVAAVAALDEIVFADETAAVLYTSADALALKAALTGTGHFIANGGNKVTFSGDSRDFEGVIAITNTIADMASRYGLGSTKSRLILHQDTAGDRFFVSATGADCMVDVPIRFSGGIKFGPSNPADTLVISNDLIEVEGGSDATHAFHVKGNLHQVAGQFGALKNHMYPSVAAKMTWTIDGDTAVKMPGGNLYCMFSASTARMRYGVTNVVKSSAFTLNVYSGIGTCIFTVPNVAKDFASDFFLGSSVGNPPSGCIDLNGLDQEFSYFGCVNHTPTTTSLQYHVIESDEPMTLTLNKSDTGSTLTPAVFRGKVSLNVIGKGTHTLTKSSESDGELRVGGEATLSLQGTSAWAGTNIVVEAKGRLDCQSVSSVTKGVAKMSIRDQGVLNIAEDVELVVCELTINGTTLENERTYTVAELAEMGYGAFVTGSGSIHVEEYVPEWTGWPSEPGLRVTVPPSTVVDVDSAEDLAKAMACREITLKGGSSVNFNALPDDLLVTNRFTGYGTVTFRNGKRIYMDSDASGLADSGHFVFDLCETVVVSNEVALGGLRSGACTLVSDQNLRAKLLFAGEGDIVNQSPILFYKGLVFGPISDSARLYQTNSWQAYEGEANQWGWTYVTNKVTFCAGNFGTSNGNTAFFCGYRTSDIVLTENTVFKSTGTTFPYDGGTWHLGSKANDLGELHPGLTSLKLICDRANAFNSTSAFQPYNASGAPTGCLDLNGFDQEAPFYKCQNEAKPTKSDGWGETSEWKVYVRSATPAQLIATSTDGATRTRIDYWFEGQAGFWLKGNDNVTLSRSQSTSTGELRVSGGSLTLDWASSWGGTNVVVDGGKLIVDATAGGKYIAKSTVETPVFNRAATIFVSDGGTLDLGNEVENVVRRFCVNGEYLKPGVYGGSASAARGEFVRDDIFGTTAPGVLRVLRGAPGQGVLLLVR